MTKEEAIRILASSCIPGSKQTEALETLIPELKESEDKRMMREFNDWLCEEIECLQNDLRDEEDRKTLNMLCYVLTKVKDWLEKQKEREPIKMEVYEVGKGTTVCGQDYKCKKDYKIGTCRYIKDAIYHCSRDGYLNDQNGVSWSCTPEWFNEYFQSNIEWAEEEKTRFVSGQFLQCKLSFDEFKEGEHYWLEYIGDDMYVGRSDNILNQKFHITPRQLYTLFSQQLEEVQGPPQEEKQVSLNYEPLFDENPSDNEIIEALIKHLKEQDGFLTAIDCVSTKAILTWLEKQKEQKPSLCDECKKKSTCLDTKYGDDRVVEQCINFVKMKSAEWNEEDETRLTNTLIMLKEYAIHHYSKDDVEKSVDWLENRVKSLRSQPKSVWSEEDSDNLERIDNYLWMLDDYVGDDCAMPQGKTDKIRENIQEILLPWLKSLPKRFNLQPKQEWSNEEYGRLFDIEHYLDGTLQLSPDRRIACINFLKSLYNF